MNAFGQKQHSQLVEWKFNCPVSRDTEHLHSACQALITLNLLRYTIFILLTYVMCYLGDPQGRLHIRNSFLGSKIVASQYDRVTNIGILAHSAKVTMTFRLSIT